MLQERLSAFVEKTQNTRAYTKCTINRDDVTGAEELDKVHKRYFYTRRPGVKGHLNHKQETGSTGIGKPAVSNTNKTSAQA